MDTGAFNSVSPPSPIHASGSSLSSSPSNKVVPDVSTEDKSLPQQSAVLKACRARGRPCRQASHSPQEMVEMEPKRKLRTRKDAKSASEDPWTELSKAPLLTPLSLKKPGQVKTLKNALHPVNSKLPLSIHFADCISARDQCKGEQ